VPLVVQPGAGFVQELNKLSIQLRNRPLQPVPPILHSGAHFAAHRNGAPSLEQIQYNAIM
jgi:hypothetical protein